jgi:hypothetical protein
MEQRKPFSLKLVILAATGEQRLYAPIGWDLDMHVAEGP